MSSHSVSAQTTFLKRGTDYYFVASINNGPPDFHSALWKTDGTEAGTVQLEVGHRYGRFYGIVAISDAVIVARQGSYLQSTDVSLTSFKDDGTSSSISGSLYSVQNMTKVNDIVFFSAETLFKGEELWKSDGTEAGTGMVKDIKENGGFPSSYPKDLTDINGTLYFRAIDDNTSTYHPWKSDGTEAGTVRTSEYTVPDNTRLPLLKGVIASDSSALTIGSTRYYIEYNSTINPQVSHYPSKGLWKQDSNGTKTLIHRIYLDGTSNVDFGNLYNIGGKPYYSVLGSTPFQSHFYSIEGDVQSVKWSSSDFSLDPRKGIYVYKNKLFLPLQSQNNGKTGIAGFVDLQDRPLYDVHYLGIINGKLIFSSNEPSYTQIWSNDGTDAGTELLLTNEQ